MPRFNCTLQKIQSRIHGKRHEVNVSSPCRFPFGYFPFYSFWFHVSNFQVNIDFMVINVVLVVISKTNKYWLFGTSPRHGGTVKNSSKSKSHHFGCFCANFGTGFWSLDLGFGVEKRDGLLPGCWPSWLQQQLPHQPSPRICSHVWGPWCPWDWETKKGVESATNDSQTAQACMCCMYSIMSFLICS